MTLCLEDDFVGRGIVINREVQIHRGQRTDIHVNAVIKRGPQETFDMITAIIEVKGSWNEELDSAMESQLVGKYLNENRCQHGLFLVGWFNSNLWDKTDNRRRRVPKVSIDEARTQFTNQAKHLSNAGLDTRAFVLDTEIR
jgi:hypothetical protein